ncbi:MAG TPA: ABC transporter ATP-binding protein [Solirubrobacteraceae bacterium]|nr:ABC transporter ATP-binding protein [Solirubrobacteraceae bacterium]
MLVTAAAPVIGVSGLTKRYGERTALRDVEFDVAAGELVAIVGPNGAGKTTLLSILAGVQRASAGTVSGPGTGAAIGWAPQQPAVYAKLSVAENLKLFARLQRVADPDAAVARMLAQTGLGERAQERVERLSGGNRQRVNVALGLIGDPPALALDEPTSALDPGQRERVWEFVGGLARSGTAVLFSTHHLGEVHRYATRAIVLADGELLFDGAPSDLIAANGGEGNFESAFVAFLRERGHA